MPDIHITVRDKIAIGDRSRIVCGNSDYIAIFDFDAEWDPYDTKTARFVYAEHSGQYVDVVFTGTECPVPVLRDVIGVTVGVFSGDLHTTTPAWFECDKSILCGGGSPAAPPDDVYNQIMELIHGLGTPDEKTIAAAVADYILAHPIQESDPTVPDWAKEEKKPSYTADEVGALSAESLPSAIDEALAKAKESGAFDGADGKDGDDGQDGITPTIGDNGNWHVGQTDTGVAATGPQGIQGETGQTGAAGYTPVRGTDYWTAEDQQAIVDDVLAALPAWEGGSY